MPQDDLEDLKDAVEIGREHAPPVVLGAIDERVSAAAPDAGVGEASVDAERVAANACSIAARSVTSQARASTGAPKRESSASASPFFRALRPQIETAQPAPRERPRHAEADAAIAPGDDRHPARKIEIGRHSVARLSLRSLLKKATPEPKKHGARRNSTGARQLPARPTPRGASIPLSRQAGRLLEQTTEQAKAGKCREVGCAQRAFVLARAAI
jgi:hypothetical protein